MSRYAKARDWLWVGLFILLGVPVAVHVRDHEDGLHAPPEQGPLLSGAAALDSLLEAAAGGPVLVNFWATWCTPCVRELPHIDRVYREMREERVLAVAVDIGDPELATLQDFREGLPLAMPVVWLPPEEAESLVAAWELPDLLPVTVVLGPGGVETARAAGAREEDWFRAAVTGMVVSEPGGPDSPEAELHVNVVGPVSDSTTLLLMEAAVELAGEEGVDLFDPLLPADSAAMDSLMLPRGGWPYAQPCVGAMCGRPSRTPEELVETVSGLTGG